VKTTAKGYAWFNDLPVGEAGCVTVVPAADEAAVLKAFGARLETAQPVESLQSAISASELPSADWVYVARVGDALVVVEDNGYQGTRREVLAPASKASGVHKAAAFFWNVNALTEFAAARRGKIQCSVEILGAEPEDLDGVPRALRRLVLEGGSEEGDMLAAGGALVAAYTEVALSVDMLRGGTIYEIVAPTSALETFDPDDPYPLLPPRVVTAVRALPSAVQRRLAEWATVAATREAGVDSEPAVQRVLAALGTGQPPALLPELDALASRADSLADKFGRLEDDLEMGGMAMPEHPFYVASNGDRFERGWAISHLEGLYLRQRSSALEATRHVTHGDALSAAILCLRRADTTFAHGRTTRGWLFEENEKGRWHTGEEPNPRHLRFADVVDGLLADLASGDDDGVWERATAALPPPLTDQQRTQAIEADALTALEGEFATYQVWRPDEDDEDGASDGTYVSQLITFSADDDEAYAEVPAEYLVQQLAQLDASLAVGADPRRFVDLVLGAADLGACIQAVGEAFGLDHDQVMMALHSPVVNLSSAGLADLHQQRQQVQSALEAVQQSGDV
jgi:hypothetical protein